MTISQIDPEAVRNILYQVIDPELGCNIVDLGLIYDIQIKENKVIVQMTLTTKGCPMHESIANGVQMAVLNVEGVQAVDVKMVWDPPWHPKMMSDFAKAHLGISEEA